MNKSQEQAVAYFRAFLERHYAKEGDRFPQRITTFDVKPTDYGTVWISARCEYGTEVSPNSVLRVMDYNSWLVSVGQRGALTVKMCPTAMEQFNGQRAFRMKFKVK